MIAFIYINQEVDIMDKLQDLKNKEVIDVYDGRRLGFVCDCEIDIISGKLLSLIVPRQGGNVKSFFAKQENIIIPWRQIKKIGDDIIIVETRKYDNYEEQIDCRTKITT